MLFRSVLEELDKLKAGKLLVAAECRQAIRLIDQLLGVACPEDVEKGVPIQRGKSGPKGFLSILMNKRREPNALLPALQHPQQLGLHGQRQLAHLQRDTVQRGKGAKAFADIAHPHRYAGLGQSGCGKTTLLRCIAGLERQDDGALYLGDRDVSELAPRPGDW